MPDRNIDAFMAYERDLERQMARVAEEYEHCQSCGEVEVELNEDGYCESCVMSGRSEGLVDEHGYRRDE